jgi:hypothetical protein
MTVSNGTDCLFISTGEATALLPAREQSLSPIAVIATEKIRNTFDDLCIR